MSRAAFLLRRSLWTIVALWLVLSGTFFVFAYTPDPNLEVIKFYAADFDDSEEEAEEARKEAAEAYIEARNYDEPVLQRYGKWMVNYATLQWGYSTSRGERVMSVFRKTVPITLTYLVPAILLSVLLGVSFGTYAATHQHGILDRLGTTFAYTGLGIPIIFLGPALGVLAFDHLGWTIMSIDSRYGLYAPENVGIFLLPAVVMTFQLAAVQVRHTRAEGLEYVNAEFVKTFRAGGARTRDVARHVLRNASLSLISLFFSETLAVLLVSIIVVEAVFPVPGLGAAMLTAFERRDIGLILATTMLPLVIGVVGNFLQDVLYAVLDPRIGEDM